MIVPMGQRKDRPVIRNLFLIVPFLIIGCASSGRFSQFHQAAQYGRLQEVQNFIDEGADVNAASGIHDYRPLLLSVINNELDTARMLIDNGAKVNQKGESQYNHRPIHMAVFKRNKPMVKLLLASGADINIKNSLGITPLHLAIAQQYPEITEMLLEEGARIDLVDKSGNTPLHYAAEIGDIDLIEMLLSYRAPVNAVNDAGKNPYLTAVQNGKSRAAAFLQEHSKQMIVAGTLFEEAVAFKQKDDWENAAAKFKQLLDVSPQNIPARFELGLFYDNNKEYDKAIEQFQNIADILHERHLGLREKLLTAVREGRPAPRVSEMFEVSTRDIERAYTNLALVYLHQDKPKKTAETFYSLGEVLGYTGLSQLAIIQFNKGLEYDRDPSPETYRALGKLHGQAGHYAEAIGIFQLALEKFPESSDIRNDLGIVHAQKGNRELAKLEFEKAIALNGQYLPARQNLAVYYFDEGAFDQALREWQALQTIDPQYPDIQKSIRLAEEKLNDTAR